MKKIWIFNHYATNQFFDKAGRHYSFAKYLIQAGYQVRIFCASTVHNSENNLIMDGRLYFEDTCDDIPFVFIKTRDYSGNGKQRILNMLGYYRGLLKAAGAFEKPDVIIGSSVHPLACVAAIRLSQKYNCRNIVEIRDLWPESIVALGMMGRNNPIIRMLYKLEKWIYTKANTIIFTMEGGRDYIIEKGWDKAHGGPVDLSKVYHINNGVDLEVFDYNKAHCVFSDQDLDEPNTFKVVYTGSIRRANGVDLIVRCAEKLLGTKIKFFIYGDGPEQEKMHLYCIENDIDNVFLKGKIAKNEIPSVLSKCDLMLLNYQMDSNLMKVLRFGGSHNKMFEYFASGKPVLANFAEGYCVITKYRSGKAQPLKSAEAYAEAVRWFAGLSPEEYNVYCQNARRAARDHDFKVLTAKLLAVVEDANESHCFA